MSQDFYKQRLIEQFGVVPDEDEQTIIHDIIYDELCLGIIRNQSREKYLQIIGKLIEKGVEAVILGCTEIALLIQQVHTSVKLYDTTAIHAEQAIKQAILT